MKTKFFFLSTLLIALLGVCGCSGDDNETDFPVPDNSNNQAPDDSEVTESLYGEWWLVGWNDGGTWFEVDTNFVSHRHMSIDFQEDGYTMAYSMVNEIFVGELILNGNELSFGGEMKGGSTAVLGSRKENLFFEEHICDIKSYQLEGKQLKLYYTDNDYFIFTKDFDDSEEFRYAWKNGLGDGKK